MRKSIQALLALLLASSMHTALAADEEAPAKIVTLANEKLTKLSADPVLVHAVKEENSKNKTLDSIKQADEEWMKVKGVNDFMKSFMNNPCAERLKKLKAEYPFISETFVMDNQGANVCMSDKTSDYWQGDEPKWQKSFNGGKGAVFIDKVKFDQSSQAYLVQVSLPIKDGDATIGAITIGIDVDKAE
ncbi:MAG: hypothetical protein G8345_00075 [Magnetococcales bacterium]|nr:PDC sensor domain-containing protein [Magnetococcales bacterium]NGZ25262.1 hypothetical protein [Magnetococcales bacterium]